MITLSPRDGLSAEQICDFAKDYRQQYNLYLCIRAEPCEHKLDYEGHSYCRFELNRVNRDMDKMLEGKI